MRLCSNATNRFLRVPENPGLKIDMVWPGRAHFFKNAKNLKNSVFGFSGLSRSCNENALIFLKWPKLALLINRVFARSECARSRQAFLHEIIGNAGIVKNGKNGQNRKNCQKWPKWPKSQKLQKRPKITVLQILRAPVSDCRRVQVEKSLWSQKLRKFRKFVTQHVWHVRNGQFY